MKCGWTCNNEAIGGIFAAVVGFLDIFK